MEKPYISRKEQARLTKKKIFDTTILLIRKKGYNKITIREICQNAQISIGTFYLYFSSKDDILLEIYEKIDQHMSFHTIPKDSALQDYQKLICEYFSTYLNYMIKTQEKELLQEIYRNFLYSGENKFLSKERPLYQAVISALSDAEENGKIQPGFSSSDVCNRLFLFVQSYVFQWLIDNNLTSEFITQTCLKNLELYLKLFLI